MRAAKLLRPLVRTAARIDELIRCRANYQQDGETLQRDPALRLHQYYCGQSYRAERLARLPLPQLLAMAARLDALALLTEYEII